MPYTEPAHVIPMADVVVIAIGAVVQLVSHVPVTVKPFAAVHE